MYGKILIQCDLIVRTGMHIGASGAFSAIGAVDSPVVRVRTRRGRAIVSGLPRYAHGKSNRSRQQPQGKAPHAAGKKFFR